MEAVTEVGIENILSDRESTPGSLPGLELEGFACSTAKKPTLTKSQSCLSDFDARYLGALDDFDELEEIEPGSLTVNETGRNTITLHYLTWEMLNDLRLCLPMDLSLSVTRYLTTSSLNCTLFVCTRV